MLHRRYGGPKGSAGVSPIPWFVGLFIATMVLRSTGLLPTSVVDGVVQLDALLLAVAMAGLGLDLRWAKVKAAGLRPLYATLAATVFISALSFGFITLLT